MDGSTETAGLVSKFLASEKIPHRFISDKEILMKLNSKLNPDKHLLAVQVNGYDKILFNIYEAVEFVNVNGLRRI